MTTSPLDLAILVAYMIGVVALGSWTGRATRSAADFVVGRRDAPWWLILFSIVATETSTVTFLSIPGFSYGRDMTWLQIVVGFVVGRAVIAALMLPQYFRGELLTAYEVLQRRFGGATKAAASLLFVVTRTAADGLRLFLSALVMQQMLSIPLALAVVIIGVATIGYTFWGGMRAVLWTDLAQFVVYMGGAALALVLLCGRLDGGLSELLRAGLASGKLRVIDASFDLTQPYGLWAGLVGGVFIALASHGVDQLMVQRYLSARSLGDARRALVGSGFVVLAQFALFLLIGVGLYLFYSRAQPGLTFGRTDRVFAHFILHEMPRGVLGVLLGSIFAAAMSTLSSSLNSCAAVTVNDLAGLGRGRRDGAEAAAADADADAASRLRRMRTYTALFGALQMAVAIGAQWLTSSVVSSVIGIVAFSTGAVLGVFLLGIFTRRVGQRAALAGLLAQLVGMTVIYFATDLAWPWFALVGAAGTFAVGLVVSALAPQQQP